MISLDGPSVNKNAFLFFLTSQSWKSALVCVGNMRKGGVSPGTAAYNVALKACVEAGEWGHASKLLGDMRASGAVPVDAAVAAELEAAMTRGDEAVVASAAVADVSSCDSWGGVVGSQAGSPGTTTTNVVVGGGGGGGVGAEGSWPSRGPAANAGRGFGSVAGESWRREALLIGGSGDSDLDEAFLSLSSSSRWGGD